MFAPFHELFYPRQTVLITASTSEKTNITSVEWVTPAGEKPPMVAFSLHNTSLTLDLISTSMEFVVAIPSERLRGAVMLCGSTSGKFIDKFAEGKLTPVKAKKVAAPLVLEAVANIECRVAARINAGDHTLVVGEVLEVHPKKETGAQEQLLFGMDGKRPFGLANEEKEMPSSQS